MNETDIQKEFSPNADRAVTIQNAKFGCLLASTLMPAGSITMDHFVYPGHMMGFFELRLISALLTGIVFLLLLTERGQRHYRILAVAWYWIPMIFIALMIYSAKDPLSPYYAGFNLVLLAVGLVLPWTYREILLTATMIVGVYIGIYFLSGFQGNHKYLSNNLFFLGSTAVIIVTGSFLHNRLRFREFTLRYELEQNRRTIEENNRKLVELDQIKNRFFANISHEASARL